MNNTIKLFYSLFIGVVAAVIAKLVHPSWNLTQLLIFGLIVFAVTFILTLLIKKKRAKK
jgi:UDP-N-acetylmuramyl pentapeptide phosphotransferase/UDP-N-acetylglucosamine-1-phosphate transferase